MNPYKFQVVEFYNDAINGTHNSIVASAATLKGCMSQYQKHLKTYEVAKINHKPLKTLFYCDNVKFDVV